MFLCCCFFFGGGGTLHAACVYPPTFSEQFAESLFPSLLSASPLNCLLITVSLVLLGCNSLQGPILFLKRYNNMCDP